MRLVLLLLSFALSSRAELEMKVTPKVIEPDFTTSFTLNCALLENEDAKVVSLSIVRRTNALGNLQTGASERIATLISLTPTTPTLYPGFELLTTIGQITSFETELGSYLKLVWPSPSIDELGLYTCEAVVIGANGQLATLVAQARVTTADPVTDRLLVSLDKLEKSMLDINSTVVELQGRVDNITAEQQLLKEEAAAATTVPSFFEEGTTLDLTTEDPTLSTLNPREPEIQNATVAEDGPDHIINFFFLGNSTYFLITRENRPYSTYYAQATCEKENLALVEIQNQDELNGIEENIAPLVKDNGLVLVSGRRSAGRTDWFWQGTGDEVTFFNWATTEPAEENGARCLALTKTPSLKMTAVNCGTSVPNTYFLCEDQN
ncbi:uncharacterized protein LOC101860995 isoform X2 [Aplysia californica]|uniref:Uncharacterized protein LOC101860995 isoform X2 n=1 Tax=Aplysia californica TaxID=6500 RepID=A0ABM0K0M1_APLCA|nr:uncharacterized protein LOC101860995 isoform X2 [Aplysia californica]